MPILETTDEPPGAVTGSARAGVSPSCQDLTNSSEFPPAVTVSLRSAVFPGGTP